VISTLGLKVVLPIKTTNQSNVQMGNSRVAAILLRKRETEHRQASKMAVSAALNGRSLKGADFLPARVTLTRISAGVLDTDGLCTALKRVRDGVADALGTGDGPKDPIKWDYAQRKGPAKMYAVEILIERSQA
jgi:hypothetical protein